MPLGLMGLASPTAVIRLLHHFRHGEEFGNAVRRVLKYRVNLIAYGNLIAPHR